MAEKKDVKKEAPKGIHWIELLLIILFFSAFYSYFSKGFLRNLLSGDLSFYGFQFHGFFDFFKNNSFFFKSLGLSLAVAGGASSFIFNRWANVIAEAQKLKIYPENIDELLNASKNISNQNNSNNKNSDLLKNNINDRWQKIVKHSDSDNQSEWRLAIIEADIILDELLKNLRLPGDTIGDRLKSVEKSDFNTIEYAWEAHKTRNMIAHQGSNFMLNQRDTKRIISMYEAVFREFEII